MKKVYTAATPAEAAEIVKTIYASGYPDRMVLQKMVPGGDDHMRVLTASPTRTVRSAPCALAIRWSRSTPPMAWATMPPSSVRTRPPCRWWRTSARCWSLPLHRFFQLDIKYSGTPGDYRVFEINLRQGRSNYYVTATG